MTEPTCLHFSEAMMGFIAFGVADSRLGENQGRERETKIALHLTITFRDVRRLTAGKAHRARVNGWLVCEALGGRLPIESGTFDLFGESGQRPKTMKYRLHFRDGVGNPLTLVGEKVINGHSVKHAWRETTTLHLHIVQGHDSVEDNVIVAAGIAHLSAGSFLWQLTTFRTKAPSLSSKLATSIRFSTFFVQQLWHVYVRHSR